MSAVAEGGELLAELAIAALRLVIGTIGRDRVQAILDAEYAAADVAADAAERAKFGGENTTAPATPDAKRGGGT